MYGPEIPAGKTRCFRVPPPGEGGCQGGYGGVWLSLSWDDLGGPITEGLRTRAVGTRFDGSIFPIWDEEIILTPKTAANKALPKGTCSVSITNFGTCVGPDGKFREVPDAVITTMIEAETRGVPAK